jgi:hypothetical protein
MKGTLPTTTTTTTTTTTSSSSSASSQGAPQFVHAAADEGLPLRGRTQALNRRGSPRTLLRRRKQKGFIAALPPPVPSSQAHSRPLQEVHAVGRRRLVVYRDPCT